jgi:hypothetical protein
MGLGVSAAALAVTLHARRDDYITIVLDWQALVSGLEVTRDGMCSVLWFRNIDVDSLFHFCRPFPADILSFQNTSRSTRHGRTQE